MYSLSILHRIHYHFVTCYNQTCFYLRPRCNFSMASSRFYKFGSIDIRDYTEKCRPYPGPASLSVLYAVREFRFFPVPENRNSKSRSSLISNVETKEIHSWQRMIATSVVLTWVMVVCKFVFNRFKYCICPQIRKLYFAHPP